MIGIVPPPPLATTPSPLSLARTRETEAGEVSVSPPHRGKAGGTLTLAGLICDLAE